MTTDTRPAGSSAGAATERVSVMIDTCSPDARDAEIARLREGLPEDPTDNMLERGMRVAATTGADVTDIQLHDIWQAMVDEWQSAKSDTEIARLREENLRQDAASKVFNNTTGFNPQCIENGCQSLRQQSAPEDALAVFDRANEVIGITRAEFDAAITAAGQRFMSDVIGLLVHARRTIELNLALSSKLVAGRLPAGDDE